MLAGYLTATVLFAALPSWQDLKLGGRSLLCYILLGVAIGLVYWQQSAVDRNPHAAPRALATPDASAARERARAQRAQLRFECLNAMQKTQHHGQCVDIEIELASQAAGGPRHHDGAGMKA